MVQRTSRCQIEFAMGRMVISTLVACAAAIWPATIMGAQQRTNSEIEAVTLARQTLAARFSLPLERVSTTATIPITTHTAPIPRASATFAGLGPAPGADTQVPVGLLPLQRAQTVPNER